MGMVVDERKRKRMQSNRESARRSRMRKQKHLDDLTAQIGQLRRENQQINHTINVTTQQYVNVEADNSVLRAQMSELDHRLQSLNEIVNYMNALTGVTSFEEDVVGLGFVDGNGVGGDFGFNNHWSTNLGYLNQPIMASADVFQY